jgi:AAA family ATP:ADP antiporter
MNDPDRTIVREAIIGAGETRDIGFVPLLIRFLGEKPILKNPAQEALIGYGTAIIGILSEYMQNKYLSKNIRKNIPRVIALMDVQKSVDVLIQNLRQKDDSLRFEVICALNRIRREAPYLRFDKPDIIESIHAEAGMYEKTIAILDAQLNAENRDKPDNDTPETASSRILEARRLLIKALEERLEENLERLFRLLGLKYSPDDVYDAFRGIKSNSSEQRADAVEFLDNVLGVTLKRLIIPIIETAVMKTETDTGQVFSKIPDDYESLKMFLEGEDAYLKERVLYLLGLLKDQRVIPHMAGLIGSPDTQVRDMAKFALRQMGFFTRTDDRSTFLEPEQITKPDHPPAATLP